MFSSLPKAIITVFVASLLIIASITGIGSLAGEAKDRLDSLNLDLPISRSDFSDHVNRVQDFRVSDVDNFLDSIG